MTIAASYWPRTLDDQRYPVTAKLFQTEPDVKVLVVSQQPRGHRRGEVILVHGLEGSSDAGYMRSMAHAALENGFAAHRVNLRGCGGTEFLSKTLYHAGLTADVFALLMDLDRQRRTPAFLVGYSLGGNVVTKLAGELGDDARRLIAGVCAVSNPLDLLACARKLEAPGNRLYQWGFVASMKRRLKLRHRAMPGSFPIDGLNGVRTVYQFDDRITAPAFGFRGAEHYYGTQSSKGYLDAIRVPALFIQAKDDPMIPFEVFDHPAFSQNRNLRLVAADHGGHVGFLSRGLPRIWSDCVILEWMLETAAKWE